MLFTRCTPFLGDLKMIPAKFIADTPLIYFLEKSIKTAIPRGGPIFCNEHRYLYIIDALFVASMISKCTCPVRLSWMILAFKKQQKTALHC